MLPLRTRFQQGSLRINLLTIRTSAASIKENILYGSLMQKDSVLLVKIKSKNWLNYHQINFIFLHLLFSLNVIESF